MSRIRVIIAEDHQGMLAQIESLLRAEFEIVASVSDGPALLDVAAHTNADVAVMDITMPGMDGFEVTQALRVAERGLKVVFLTVHDDVDYRRRAFELGAKAYVVKGRMAEELVGAVRAAALGSDASDCFENLENDRSQE